MALPSATPPPPSFGSSSDRSTARSTSPSQPPRAASGAAASKSTAAPRSPHPQRPLLITHRHNIPVTTIGRTIEDLHATSLDPHLLRRARRQAELTGIRLDGVASDNTRSDLETLFLELFALHRIPPPEVNAKLGRRTVDFLWRSQRLVVEADTWTYHRGSVAFEDDHARDLDLHAAGYKVRRFTDRQLEDEPERVAAVVRVALGG